jgi:cysteinyl-tRNA synthetase
MGSRKVERWLVPLGAVLMLSLTASFGCGEGGDPAGADSVDTSPGWVYWLQDVDLGALAAAAPARAVVDYSSDGTAAGEWSGEEVESAGAGGTTLLAYLSIGEAEEYRYYWDPAWQEDPPPWLGPENREWAGNYKVRYWMDGWRAILLGSGDEPGYLDRILDQGFDGVYLDIVDAYWYWGEGEGAGEIAADTAAAGMLALIEAIAVHAREERHRPGFLVFPQNGEWLPEDLPTPAERERYYSIVDGIGLEDLFFPGEASENNPWAPRSGALQLADTMIARGGEVLSVEYVTTHAARSRYYPAARDHGFRPLATVRALDVLAP